MSNFGIVGLFLTAVLLCSADVLASDRCVETFDDFEKAVLNNSNNVQSLVRAFYQPNYPTPLSVRVVYHVKSTQGTDAIISTDQSCPAGKEIWLWVASPVFLYMGPTKLNLCALFTLNYFRWWSAPDAHVYVPNICNGTNRFNFLNDLTSKVQIYAANHLHFKDISQGYVLKGCGDDVLTILLTTTSPNNDNHLRILAQATICIFVIGNFCVIFGVVLVIWVLLQKYGDVLTRTNQILSFDNYGLFWGFNALSVVVNVLLMAHSLYIISLYGASGAFQLRGNAGLVAVQIAIMVLASLMIAIWFSRKFSLDIPSIYLWLLAPLSCFRMKETRKKVVQWLAMWSSIQCVLHFSCYVPGLFLALLASPPTVFFTLLIYITSTVCIMHTLAVNFVFWKGVKMGQGCCRYLSEFLQLLGHVLLGLAVLCFLPLISAIGVSANYGTASWSSPFSIVSIVISSLAPGGLVWVQRKIGTLWLENHNNLINASPKKKGALILPNVSAEAVNEDNGVNESAPLPDGAQT